jgi:hypothetical protein
MWRFALRNGWGYPYDAMVTKRGQLVTAPLKYNTTYFNAMTATGTAYNFITPKTGEQFVITGYIVSSDKNVNATNGAIVSIYEATSLTATSASKTILTLDLGKLDGAQVVGLNILTSKGVWINSTTDDATINLTILGYYIDS